MLKMFPIIWNLKVPILFKVYKMQFLKKMKTIWKWVKKPKFIKGKNGNEPVSETSKISKNFDEFCEEYYERSQIYTCLEKSCSLKFSNLNNFQHHVQVHRSGSQRSHVKKTYGQQMSSYRLCFDIVAECVHQITFKSPC